MSEESPEPAIGIDLGTTYSCVAVWRNDRVEVIPNEQGNRITPSCVSFKGGERLVGDGAKNVAAMNPVDTIFDAKRFIGRRFHDEVVQRDLKYVPFNVVPGPDDKPLIVVTYKDEEKQFAPEEISAMILTKMKEIAEAFLGVKVTNAVITVPAYFNDSQRQATRVAGAISGLNVLRMVVEPTAAAIAYGLYKKSSSSRNVVIFDLGGGTFDVSLLKMAGKEITVKSTSGDSHLGGEDFDNRMAHHFVGEVQRKHGRDMRGKPRAMRKLKTACERAKRMLSSVAHTTIEVECLYNGVDFESKMSRAKFEELNMDYFKECIAHVEKCLEDADIDKRDVHDVVLVGGSTRIPKLQQMLRDFFDGKELCQSIHPDEAVACGAAVRAAVLTGQVSDEIRDLTLNDVTPLSLGISTYEECLMDVVVPRNTPFPTKMKKEFYTAEDDQTFAVFKVFQGERPTTNENVLLGEFTLSGIPPALRGAQSFDVCFEIDADGILNVSAEHKLSRNKSCIMIDNVRGVVSGDKVDRMLKEAEMFKSEDERLKNKFEAKNSLERYIYETRAAVFNNSCRLSAAISRRMRREIEEAIKWLDERRAGEADVFINKREELERIWDHAAIRKCSKEN